MKVLVDTHAILWWLSEDRHLSRRARRILENSENRRLISIASLWEIAIKMKLGSLPTDGLTLRMIADELAEQEFAILPIRLDDLLQLEGLPALHRDSFDRMLISQAIEEDVPMLTTDTAIEQYPIETIW